MDITDELDNLLNPPSSPLDRVIQRREKKERDLINAQLENVAALREIHKANERTKQLDAQVAALGTDSDTVRQVTGGAMSGTGSVIGALGWISEQAGRLIESGLIEAGLGDQVRAVNEKFEEWGIAAPSEGFKGLGNWLKEGGQTVQESIRAESQYEIDQSTPTGDVLDPGSWSLGDNPSLEGYTLQMARILGEFAPQAAGLLAKNPETAVKLMGAIGGLQAGEGQASAQVDNIMASDDYAANHLRLETVRSIEQSFRMAMAGRVDYVLYEALQGRVKLGRNDWQDQFTASDQVVSVENLYFAFPKQSRCNTQALREAFANALRLAQNQGRIDALIEENISRYTHH